MRKLTLFGLTLAATISLFSCKKEHLNTVQRSHPQINSLAHWTTRDKVTVAADVVGAAEGAATGVGLGGIAGGIFGGVLKGFVSSYLARTAMPEGTNQVLIMPTGGNTGNANNPYDYVGVLHNEAMHSSLVANLSTPQSRGQLILNAISVVSNSALAPVEVKDEANETDTIINTGETDTLAMIAVTNPSVEDAQTEMINWLYDRGSIDLFTKNFFIEYFADLNEFSDASDAIEYTISKEDEIAGDNSINSQQKMIILVALSTAKHSILYHSANSQPDE